MSFKPNYYDNQRWWVEVLNSSYRLLSRLLSFLGIGVIDTFPTKNHAHFTHTCTNSNMQCCKWENGDFQQCASVEMCAITHKIIVKGAYNVRDSIAFTEYLPVRFVQCESPARDAFHVAPSIPPKINFDLLNTQPYRLTTVFYNCGFQHDMYRLIILFEQNVFQQSDIIISYTKILILTQVCTHTHTNSCGAHKL